jgi:hypothetical protein
MFLIAQSGVKRPYCTVFQVRGTEPPPPTSADSLWRLKRERVWPVYSTLLPMPLSFRELRIAEVQFPIRTLLGNWLIKPACVRPGTV